MNIIETTQLTHRYWRTEALRGLDLAVPAGSVFALLGANGAGKTTAIKVIMNLLRPTTMTPSNVGYNHAWLKALSHDFVSSARDGGSAVVAAVSLGGDFAATQPAASFPGAGGISGYLKSLAQELPLVRIRSPS